MRVGRGEVVVADKCGGEECLHEEECARAVRERRVIRPPPRPRQHVRHQHRLIWSCAHRKLALVLIKSGERESIR